MLKRTASGGFVAFLIAPMMMSSEAISRTAHRTADWGAEASGNSQRVQNWAWTTNDEEVDSYVAAWVESSGQASGATNTSGPGYQQVTASIGPIWVPPFFCGSITGYSNHWLIDGYDWEELEEHRESNGYVDPPCL